MKQRVLIRGGGEMGSGVAWRLRRCGFDVVVAEIDHPMAVRRWVSFSEAVYEGVHEVEGITARRTEPPDVSSALNAGEIPVVVCPIPDDLKQFDADVIVDAILAKRNTGTMRGMARRVIGLGPGFVAGEDVDCVIETNRGPNLGRCILEGRAEANTGVPGILAGESARRVLRTPADGVFEPLKAIGDLVKAHTPVARVAGTEIQSQLDGIVRGLLRAGTPVTAGLKVGDVDPRSDAVLCARVSEKALAIAGGVLEGILAG
jgi:xanthine dehydrogenase accessory factor